MFLAELGRNGSSQKDEVAALQTAIASLDREKDVLQEAVDQKAESMVLLQDQLHKKVLQLHLIALFRRISVTQKQIMVVLIPFL